MVWVNILKMNPFLWDRSGEIDRICVFLSDYHQVTWKVEWCADFVYIFVYHWLIYQLHAVHFILKSWVVCWFCVYFCLSLVNLSTACCSFHFQLHTLVLLLFLILRHQAVVHFGEPSVKDKEWEREREKSKWGRRKRWCLCVYAWVREGKRALLIHSF